jgi:hypothetical protein
MAEVLYRMGCDGPKAVMALGWALMLGAGWSLCFVAANWRIGGEEADRG